MGVTGGTVGREQGKRGRMCHYCGCRDMPLIRDYAEHERAINLMGDAVRAMDAGDLDHASGLLARVADELTSHWRGEESGLFAAMQPDSLYAEHTAPLVAEHRALGDFLASLDIRNPADQKRIRQEADELRVHIAKEEDGLFPASLTALDGDDWDAAITAWERAHPGAHLIADAH